ncbi:hypothetical protein SUGI_0314180 [Cryptomeria japonica]|nr:hypothetical protein SUGI_0314180 [Cryptomeria japonica]
MDFRAMEPHFGWGFIDVPWGLRSALDTQLDSGLIRSASVVESARIRRALSRWRPTEKLLRLGPVEGKKVFYWFQNAAGRDKRKKEEPERSSKWPAVLSYVQEEEVDSGSGAGKPTGQSVMDPGSEAVKPTGFKPYQVC